MPTFANDLLRIARTGYEVTLADTIADFYLLAAEKRIDMHYPTASALAKSKIRRLGFEFDFMGRLDAVEPIPF